MKKIKLYAVHVGRVGWTGTVWISANPDILYLFPHSRYYWNIQEEFGKEYYVDIMSRVRLCYEGFEDITGIQLKVGEYIELELHVDDESSIS